MSGFINRFIERFPAHWRQVAVFFADLVAVVLAWVLAYGMRFNGAVPPEFMRTGLSACVLILPIHAILFRSFGLYRGIWVFASLPDLVRIVRAVASSLLISVVACVFVGFLPPVPRTIFVLHPVFLLMWMGGSRAAYRLWKEHRRYGDLLARGQPVIILGAGRAGANLVAELSRSPAWRVVGLLDDDPNKIGREISGIKVYGRIDELIAWSFQLKAKHAIVAMPSMSRMARQRAASECLRAGVHAMTLPSIEDVVGGGVQAGQFRDIDLHDLIGRAPIDINTPEVGAMLTGRVVMVTGGGGSIGSELCRQIARFRPAQLVLLEVSEYALYRIHDELRERYPQIEVVPFAGDVRDGMWLEAVFRQYPPSIVFHAAAYKHVPLMEERNAWQAIRNNAFGTYKLAAICVAHRVERFVLVSTDKAVNPTNVMGASKRMAEMICQVMQQGTRSTRFEIVRFGNVIGSAGSVIPKFREQIARGGPVTVTHAEITRYFMSIPEAAQLVLQAAAMGHGGEVFVMDMGEPVRIADLARDLIRLSGFGEDQIRIVYTGLRPGEKLFEELLSDQEETRETHHPKLRVARAREVVPEWLDEVVAWMVQRGIPTDAEVRRDLRRWVPEYTPTTRPGLNVVARSHNENLPAA
ncbi:nucleoside-diphosphate sugar epimerase/dehydratase [Niveibacterium umoris]|uniref:FlaA1/EpsC-like NDP-sugar epimerase n=1 Tax=Niveibacterium umoris TaxID=1193620 RepID=A0A840BMZ8_9RHOO|nr:nucleoside-diphosphate sugar epimerase/dehydratase [Niveibacterium umoris]MBB4012226.1 FlaA1/EpsC-like NDP-sugar epimerase [Niveibacterium umoris]